MTPPPRVRTRPARRRLPVTTVRDLLGIARALYAAWRAAGAPAERLEALRVVGEDLRVALELALQVPDPDTMGHRAAVERAERATLQLGELVAGEQGVALLVAAAGARVRELRKGS